MSVTFALSTVIFSLSDSTLMQIMRDMLCSLLMPFLCLRSNSVWHPRAVILQSYGSYISGLLQGSDCLDYSAEAIGISLHCLSTSSPGTLCQIGANGSGKSNFFHAIRFVISDLFQNLRSEDRHALLHEGAGHQVLSAFVEIVFDNSDNRIPVDKEEVHLRRTIGHKKDEYFLDGKHISKTEVMNLLESAGFSRSNPYYVVQQGKISQLTLMKDSERLDLLKEIGGTRVYEERHRESLKIMQETGNKRKQIIQVDQYLDERLKELDEEKEELIRKYKQLDKQRKSLEYTIYDKEIHEARQKLAEVEESRSKVSETSTKMYNSVLDAHEQSKELDKKFKDLTKEVQILSKEKEAIENQRTTAIKKHAQLDLDYKDLQEKITRNIRAKLLSWVTGLVDPAHRSTYLLNSVNGPVWVKTMANMYS